MKDVFGSESHNRTTFTGCRQYTGESTISFDDPAESSSTVQAAAKELNIPAGLFLEIAIETPITEGQSAVGDPVTAILRKSVKLGSGLIAPKGALVHGRLTHLRRQQTSRPAWVVGMTFFEIEWPDTRASLRAKLESAPALSLLADRSPEYRMIHRQAVAEAGVIIVPDGRSLVPRGFQMVWRTEPFQTEDKSDPIRTRN